MNKLPITTNPLLTKSDLQLAFHQLTRPLQPYFSPGSAQLNLPGAGASYPRKVAGFEGFSRVLWGLVPLLAGGHKNDELLDVYVKGIRNGTNPAHEEYWGDVADYDQKSVEMAAFGFALALIPEILRDKLTKEELDRFSHWLRQINERELWDCNWLFFRVMVQLGFKRAALPFDSALTERTLDQMERFYLNDGWYADGLHGHSDYYVPFAFHYYGLLYAKLMEADDPGRSRLYKESAERFAQQFVYWFADHGASLPYGRSLTYRFSQSAFWSALVFAEASPFSLGVLKGLILRNLRWWFSQPIFQPDGTLSVGYAYPNLIMAENYNAPGSPYWALKTFLPLALPDNHPFWLAEELPLPALDPRSAQQAPHMVVCRTGPDRAAHVFAFNSGHLSTNEHTHTSAKYEKFVYSTLFGFSVPRAEWGLAQGAYDSTLALSEGDNLYRVKRKCEEISVTEQMIFAKWTPWSDVEVQTWLIPGAPWHVRIHRIESARSLEAAEGGFALGIDCGNADGLSNAPHILEPDGCIYAISGHAMSGMKPLYGGGRMELIYPHANTNLLHSRTVIPTVRASLEKGVSWLVTAVYGDMHQSVDSFACQGEPPFIEVIGKQLAVYRPGCLEPSFRTILD